jgi:sugar lactone lactonase YvrE
VPGKSEIELEGTRAGYPNGVVAATDGRYIYFNAWTDMEVHKCDLKKRQDVEVVKLDFMPDNLKWTQKGHLLAAGVAATVRVEAAPRASKASQWPRSTPPA